jgi:hypothetical protein
MARRSGATVVVVIVAVVIAVALALRLGGADVMQALRSLHGR